MNEYDSDQIANLLESTGKYQSTMHAGKADILVLNTCSIREKAQEKLFHQLGRWKSLKQQRPRLIICVGGCVASQEGEQIMKRAPYVDIVFGPQTLHRLPTMLLQVQQTPKTLIDITFPEIEKFDAMPKPKANGPTAFVSIMEGCNKYCTYCIVPYTRGREVSRPVDDIIFEIVQLAEQGVREINLLGQNVNAYRGSTHTGSICSFANLLRLVTSLDKIDRVRFTTSHPIEFTDDIIAVYADTTKLVSHLHLPIQSGSDYVLGLMQRDHTVLEYKNIVGKLRQIRPDIHISSDFIVGFPGEDESHFEQTLQLVKEIYFDFSYSFIFSPRPGTPAANLPDHVDIKQKKDRLYRLQHQLNQQAMHYSHQMLGSKQWVLVEGESKKDNAEFNGRTENNRVVNFKGSKELIGQFAPVIITDVYTNSLRGKIVE